MSATNTASAYNSNTSVSTRGFKETIQNLKLTLQDSQEELTTKEKMHRQEISRKEEEIERLVLVNQ